MTKRNGSADKEKLSRLLGESQTALAGGVLGLAAQGISDAEVQAMLADPRVPTLKELDLQNNPLTAAGVGLLLASPKLRGVQVLALSDSKIGDDGLRQLAASPVLDTVQSLLLGGVAASSAGVEVLAGSPHLGALQNLDLSDQSVGDAAAAALARLPPLRRLSLQRANLGAEGARALVADTKALVLELNGNRLGPGALVGLAAIAPSLSTLSLKSTALGDEDVAALAALSAGLKVLDLTDCPIGDKGVKALTQARWLGGLAALVLVRSSTSAPAREELQRAYGARPGLTL